MVSTGMRGMAWSLAARGRDPQAEAQAAGQRLESRERRGDVGAVADPDLAGGALGRHRQGHGDAVVAVAVGVAAPQPATADDRAVRGFPDVGAQGLQRGRHRGDAVGLLHPQFGRAGNAGFAFGQGRGHEQRREFVDHVRHQGHRDVDAAQAGMAYAQVGHGLAALLAGRGHRDVGPHGPQRVQQAGPPRVHPDLAQAQVGAGHQGRGHQEKRRRRKVRRHPDRRGAKAVTAFETGVAGTKAHRPPEGREHALGVIAGRVRLADLRRAAGVQASQQHR